MPCNSEYMRATDREVESQLVAGHLHWLYTRLGKLNIITPELVKAKDDYYGNIGMLDAWTADLCGLIRSLTDEQKDKLLYDGRNAKSRSIADWWDRHQAWDRRREEDEKEEEEIKLRDLLINLVDDMDIEDVKKLIENINKGVK